MKGETAVFMVLAVIILLGGGVVGYNLISDMQTRARAVPYKPTLDAINDAAGLPSGLLYWLAYAESRYRADIISGATKSPAGAIGMFQFLPSTAAQYRFNPTEWQASAHGAAQYMKDLYKRFGDWRLAIASYNDGPGNVHHALVSNRNDITATIASLPKETRDYVASVGGGIGVA
jgi:soluble lytic murein transglycosylase-like protein